MKQDVSLALAKGIPVFTDRSDSSTFAYQVHAEQHPELSDWCLEMRDRVFGHDKPTCYIFLEVNPDAARNRATGDQTREVSYFDAKPIEYYKRVAKGYRDFANVTEHCSFVDGMRNPQEIHEDIWRIVAKELGL